MASPVSPSPVSLTAAAVVILGALGLSLGLAREPTPLPSDVSAPVTLAPSGQDLSPGEPARRTPGGSDNGGTGTVIVVPNEPYSLGSARDSVSDQAIGGADGSVRQHRARHNAGDASSAAPVTTTATTGSYRLGGPASGAGGTSSSSGGNDASDN
jgi:hypothetical protein